MEEKSDKFCKPVKASLIGVGGYGIKLARAVENSPFLEIISCYHPDKRKSHESALRIGCRAAADERDALLGDGIEAVIITTPDHMHSHYIEMAMEAGRHIFVEKPMVGRWDEVLTLKKKIDSYDGVFFVGHNMRREPAFRFIKSEYDRGALGELVTFHIILSHGGAFNWNEDYWRAKPELCREGPMRVNGVHASDVLEYIFGPIDSVFARIDSSFASHPAPDSGVALVRIAKACGAVYTHWVVPSINKFHFQFTNAIAEYDMQRLIMRYGRDVNCMPRPEQNVKLPEVDARLEQMNEFARAIIGLCGVETGWHQGMRAVMFFEACYRSQEQNREVKLEELLK